MSFHPFVAGLSVWRGQLGLGGVLHWGHGCVYSVDLYIVPWFEHVSGSGGGDVSFELSSAWFLRGVSYRVPVHMEYVGWRDSLDTIENGWLHGNLGSLSGETISPTISRSETRSNQGQSEWPHRCGAYIAQVANQCGHHR